MNDDIRHEIPHETPHDVQYDRPIPRDSKRDIRVGVIGFGLAARVFHAPFVSAVPGLRLKTFVERTSDHAARAYPETRTVRTPEELFADRELDLVIVATPNPTHFTFARQALEAGKHVVIDKPFAPTSSEAGFLLELAESRGLVVAPFHNRRWDGDFLTLKKLLGEGRLGRISTIESHFDRYRPIPRENTWKEATNPANGLLMDLGPHLIDQAVALYGVPRKVWASIRSDRDQSAIEDAFDICLMYETKAHPSLLYWCRSTMTAAVNAPRFTVHGRGGSFVKHGLDPQEPALVAGATVPHLDASDTARWLEEEASHWGTLTTAENLADPAHLAHETIKTERGDYRNFYVNVRDTIRGSATLAVPSEAGFAAVKLIELARQSSSEGRVLDV